MRNAYDVILSDCVDAESAAQGSGSEQYRYECARCGEEVHLRAVGSQNKAPHFRHRNGNNDIECENYLGSRNTIINSALSRRNVKDKIEFYFSNITKTFRIGVKFSAEEIASYEQSKASFQVRNSRTGSPSTSITINRSNFCPNASESIPIQEFSWEYYVSSSMDAEPRKYELFKKREYLCPSFFKIQAGDGEDDFTAKLVRDDILYTNTPYLVVFTRQYGTLSFQRDVRQEIRFNTMGKDFTGVVVVFTQKTAMMKQQLESWKYRLEANEILTLLWPPSVRTDELMSISSNCAYLYTTFELRAHGNTNASFMDIAMLGNGVSKISINKLTKIYMRGAELVLDKCVHAPNEHDVVLVKQEISKNYDASDDGAYLFSCSGVSSISNGASVLLAIGSEVRHYSFGYLDKIVCCQNQ